VLGAVVAANVVIAAVSMFTIADELGGPSTTTTQVPVEHVVTPAP
jgi:hypothetical protein